MLTLLAISFSNSKFKDAIKIIVICIGMDALLIVKYIINR